MLHVLKITCDPQGECIIFMNTVFGNCSKQSTVQNPDVQPKIIDYMNDILYKINSISF
jgi:hypothetical protein